MFDMVWEPTENHWCMTHFYSTSLWESRGIRSLSARPNTLFHSYKKIFLPLLVKRSHNHGGGIRKWGEGREDCSSVFIWRCILREDSLKCMNKLDFMHQLFSFFTKMQCLLDWETVCIHYSWARKFWSFLELLQKRTGKENWFDISSVTWLNNLSWYLPEGW